MTMDAKLAGFRVHMQSVAGNVFTLSEVLFNAIEKRKRC